MTKKPIVRTRLITTHGPIFYSDTRKYLFQQSFRFSAPLTWQNKHLSARVVFIVINTF
jgi:hypothetical protein